MSAPAAIANAVADALGLDDVELPLTPARVWELMRRVKPAPFRYERPETVEEAAALLAEHGDEAKVLAGGQSLVPLLNFRLVRPAVLVDVNRVAGLDRIDGARVGATVRQNDLAGVPLAAAGAALGRPLRDAQPRHRRRLDRPRRPVAPSCRSACSCSAARSSTSKGREIPADDFFRSHFTTALEPDELVVETVWPEGGAVAFDELAQRHGDFALSLAACSVRVENGDGDGGPGRRRRGDRPAAAARARARRRAGDRRDRARGRRDGGRGRRPARQPARLGRLPQAPHRRARRARADAGRFA